MKRQEFFGNISSVPLERPSRCGAGGHSTTGTGPESPVPRGAAGGGVAGAGEGRG
jgi:hypothetical protein